MNTLEGPQNRTRTPFYSVSISLREAELLRLEQAAEAVGLSRAAAIKRGIMAWVEQWEAQSAGSDR